MRVLYGDEKTNRILGEWEAWERRGLLFKVDDAKAALRRRMFDLSQFCKTLKETYSMSYNSRHAHVGTIWGSRFKSVLLSPDYQTLMTVGSYIDLNPVRAEIVKEPGDYRWSGYGTAIRGNALSRKGLCALIAVAYARREVPFHNAQDVYASALDGWIETPAPAAPEADATSPEGLGSKQPEKEEALPKPAGRPVFIPEKVEADLRQGAKLTLFAMLRCKVRYFSHGLAVGPLSFVRYVIGASASKKDPSRPWGCCEDVELYNARWLRGEDKISVPKRRVGRAAE